MATNQNPSRLEEVDWQEVDRNVRRVGSPAGLSRTDQDDLVGDVMQAITVGFTTFDPNRGTFGGWVGAIARRIVAGKFIPEIMDRKRRWPLSEVEDRRGQPGPDGIEGLFRQLRDVEEPVESRRPLWKAAADTARNNAEKAVEEGDGGRAKEMTEAAALFTVLSNWGTNDLRIILSPKGGGIKKMAEQLGMTGNQAFGLRKAFHKEVWEEFEKMYAKLNS